MVGNGPRTAATKFTEKEQADLKEKLTTAIKQHPNYRGEPMGSDLPRFIKELVKLKWCADRALSSDYNKETA